jgi:hypothetical protein
MAVPDFQTMMLPLLTLASDGQRHTLAEAIEQLAQEFQLSDDGPKSTTWRWADAVLQPSRLDDDLPQEGGPAPGSRTGALPSDGSWLGSTR